MAGFDFYFDCSDGDRKLGARTLNYMRKHARTHGLTLSYRYDAEVYEVRVDGPLAGCEALIGEIREALLAFGAGYSASSGSRNGIRVARRVYICYLGGFWEFRDSMKELMDSFNSNGWQLTPGSVIFDVGAATHLKGAANSLSRCLLLYFRGRLGRDTLIEECHKFADLALKAALPQDPSRSFALAVTTAYDRGVFGTGKDRDENIRDALLKLNKFRGDSKHQGLSIPVSELNSLLWDVISGIHLILRQFTVKTMGIGP